MGSSQNILSGRRLKRFEALQKFLVPRTKKFNLEQSKQSQILIEQMLQEKSVALRLQFFLFLFVIDIFSFFLGLHTFKNLSEEKQKKVIQCFFDSPIGILRKGFWGLNTLAKMGVYGQESLYDDIGYKIREVPRD